MPTASLLAIVEVPQKDRVRCQAPGCSHTIYKRIHVVRAEGSLQVLGSTCFEKQFRGQPVVRENPRLTHSNGRELSEAERALLSQNTEQLIAELEVAYAKVSAQAVSSPSLSPTPRARRRQGFLARGPEVLEPSLEAEAKRRVRDKHGVDPEQPGWRGLVLAEARAMKGENAA